MAGHSASLLHADPEVGRQYPGQSAPPFSGSQSSGASTHSYPSSHASPANPPHFAGSGSRMQTPPQSAPFWFGSQSSPSSSTHVKPGGQDAPAMPPHESAAGQPCSNAAHLPFMQAAVGQEYEPSGQVRHTWATAQSPSLVHSVGESGTQTPPQSAPPRSGSQSSSGSSTHVEPGGQGKPAMPPQNPASGHAGYVTAHLPFTHSAIGHETEEPSGQGRHDSMMTHPASVTHSAGESGTQIPGQSAPSSGSHSAEPSSAHSNPGGQVSPAIPPHGRGASSGTQKPKQSTPVAGSHATFGSCRQTCPGSQSLSVLQPPGSGQVG
jgi:hypothetical protein